MKFYIINYSGNIQHYGNFHNYIEALNFASTESNGCDFTLEEYDSEEDYCNSLGV